MTSRQPAMREPTYFILAALLARPLHGYGIVKCAHELSDGRLRLTAGTLYTALDRLTAEGLVAVDHEEVVAGRARRYYRLTRLGDEALQREAERMMRAAMAVTRRGRPTTPAPELG